VRSLRVLTFPFAVIAAVQRNRMVAALFAGLGIGHVVPSSQRYVPPTAAARLFFFGTTLVSLCFAIGGATGAAIPGRFNASPEREPVSARR
jgi:hypothetical protein